MAERKEYRSAVRSRKWIRQAFLELLREKPYEKITVTDIVTRADINRSTFYAHYPDVKGLVEEIQEEVIRQSLGLVSTLDYHSLFHEPNGFVRELLSIGVENRELYTLLGRSPAALDQLDKLKSELVRKALEFPEIPDEIRSQKKYAIRLHFFIGGIINTYQQWLQGSLDCTTEEIIEDISEMIVLSAQTMLKTDGPA